MGVVVGGAAVRGPAGVADAQTARRQRVGTDGRVEVDDLARLLTHLDGAVGHDRDAGGVVPAVLHAAQALDHHPARLAGTDVTDDSAHGPNLTVGS